MINIIDKTSMLLKYIYLILLFYKSTWLVSGELIQAVLKFFLIIIEWVHNLLFLALALNNGAKF